MLSTDFVDGAPVWVDLGAPDVARAAQFYGSVSGWKFEPAGPEAGGYGMFTQDGKAVAAAGPLSEQGAAPSWTVYFRTSDARTPLPGRISPEGHARRALRPATVSSAALAATVPS